MLKISEIKDLIKCLDESSLDEMVYEYEGEKIKLKKNQPVSYTEPVPYAQPQKVEPLRTEANLQVADEDSNEVTETSAPIYDYQITSPMVGTFYLSSSPESGPYVEIGDQISKKTVVCIIEAMKLFNEIEAEVDGEIVEILAEDGELVEYGQPLFGVKRK
ncbi:acetyl-CoA carboxylase biotin carboxyl carrier protein [Amphibacillus cookii]|uniref:acetyl-CoA carboxylase biotin carboxyl carrier protein n=1 Tax=Amphibacillus cookii TaxID=767787 RepID=UPI00195A0842|nr:acetyl-CoA carboxylase biotin carboxyl carrier protein [Amphibacillus cookii]MBM7542435.1 acetyl-CoA carboxylase biotin carboxyl carrier protein [Amphibacillus cookii]